tara:strand:+ start:10027 stop:10893 length:867 start_codon:yes stop_codon:yes gene_type:complete
MPRDAKWVAVSAHRAEVFTVKCQHDKAKKVWKDILRACQALYGKQDPRIVAALKALADSYEAQKNYAPALKARKRVVRILKTQLGKNDKDVLCAKIDAARTLLKLRKLLWAEDMLWPVVSALERSVGPEDETTLSAKTCLAQVLHAQQQDAEVEPLIDEVLTAYFRSNICSEVHIIEPLKLFASVCFCKGEQEAGLQVMREVLDTHKRVFGEDHIATYEATYDLAEYCCKVEKYHEAEDLFGRVTHAYAAFFGEGHAKTEEAKKQQSFAMKELRKDPEVDLFIELGIV